MFLSFIYQSYVNMTQELKKLNKTYRIARLILIILGDKFLVRVFVDLFFRGDNLLHINRCILEKMSLYLADLDRWGGIFFGDKIHNFRDPPEEIH